MGLDPEQLAAAIDRSDRRLVRDLLRRTTEADADRVAAVLADRDPPWLAEFVDRWLSGRRGAGPKSWLVARALVRLGVIARPQVPQYTTTMLTTLAGRPLAFLIADPGLLNEEVWRLFTVPSAVRPVNGMLSSGWAEAIVAMAGHGRLDRGRLLDACLDAFTRDSASDRMGWYVAFHDQLKPSASELAARAQRYLRLLSVPSADGMLLGQRVCGMLLGSGLLPAAEFLGASGPALVHPLNAVALGQLRLLGSLAGDEPASS